MPAIVVAAERSGTLLCSRREQSRCSRAAKALEVPVKRKPLAAAAQPAPLAGSLGGHRGCAQTEEGTTCLLKKCRKRLLGLVGVG